MQVYTDLSGPITRYTWTRIMDVAAPVHGIVAERAGDGVIGIANYIIHKKSGRSPGCLPSGSVCRSGLTCGGASLSAVD